MNERYLTENQIRQFAENLIQEEKSRATVEKYLRDVRAFALFMGGSAVTKERVIAYKRQLLERGYAVRSINSMLASINALLRYLGWNDCRTKSLRQQRSAYCPEEKELTRAEYLRLLQAAQPKPRLKLLMETICATGIRVSELKYFTVEALAKNEITISCKNKTRTILVPGKLKNKLLGFAKKQKIHSGAIFRSASGKPLDRSWIWAQMKKLCGLAGVLSSKVFPHNLRKLFARTFYNIEKDIAKLADILGHSSIDTTRIYIMTTGSEHRQKIEQLGLIL